MNFSCYGMEFLSVEQIFHTRSFYTHNALSELSELVSKVFTGGNLKNLDWENCQVNPIETCIHKHLFPKLDCFILFLLMTTVDQMVVLELGFYGAHLKKINFVPESGKD